MRAVIQRVLNAKVDVDDECVLGGGIGESFHFPPRCPLKSILVRKG